MIDDQSYEKCEVCGEYKPTKDMSIQPICDECYSIDWPTLRADNARLEAENEKMRGALQNLLDRIDIFYNASSKNDGPKIFESTFQIWREIIKSALSPSTESEESDE